MAETEAAGGFLSPELAASLGVAGGDEIIKLSAKKKQKPGGGGGGVRHGPRRSNPLPAEKKLSKSQKRKNAKVEEDKRKRDQRGAVVARLNAAKMVSDESLTLLAGSASMGQRLSKRETLRRELKAERAGIQLPGSSVENSRLTKRERPEGPGVNGGGESDDESSSSDEDNLDDSNTFGRKQSWPLNKAMMPTSTGTGTGGAATESYGPIHPLDQARLDLERIKNAEAIALRGDDDDTESDEDDEDDDERRAKFKTYLAQVTALADLIRQRDPEQLAERTTEALGPNAVAASLDPKDLAAKAVAANEAASTAAAKKYPGVFVGASFSVPVTRQKKIQTQREGLPILGSEHEIVDCVNHNPIVVICGETGCGKTTQVPQFLFEAGYGDPSCAAHPGAIAVTQPRRVAVTSTATRVADELNVKLGEEVGYQVRYDKKVTTERDGTTQDAASSKTTKIKFMTDGVLLKEMQSDLLLRKYSVVVIDEAHERGVNTDILLGLLSRVVPLRAELFREKRPGITPLRLVVMSATLRVSEFVENKKLCPTPPALLRIAARQFPVTIHFARETIHGDYVGAARKKVVAIHKKLPPGGILVFVTGQREVDQLVRKLKAAYPKPSSGVNSLDDAKECDKKTKTKQDSSGHELDAFSVDALDAAGEDFDDDFGGEDTKGDGNFDGGGRDDFDNDDDSDDSASDVSEEDDVVVHGGEGVTPDEAKAAEESWCRAHAPTTELANKGGGDAGEKEEDTGPGYLHVLPLYAMLPPDLQKRVFDPPPPGARVVVVATNVAETSLTIPNTRYVIDCGREKRRVFNAGGDGESEDGDASATNAGMSRFEVGWISKASAEQRCGRAGRTGPGHAYRLFSSAHFVNDLDDHAPPSILTQPVDGVVLQMRAMGIDRVARFPFLTPPNFAALKRAQRTLAVLGALRPTLSVTSVTSQNPQTQTFGHFGSFGDDGDVGSLTELGRAMAALPIGPRHARMLLAAAASENSKNGGGCLAAAVVAAAALSLDSPFLRDEFAGGDTSGDAKDDKETAQRRRKLRHAFHHPHSDALSAARALVAYDTQRGPREAAAFCLDHCLHGRTMREASDLRRQLLRALTSNSVASAAFGKPARAELARARAFVNLKVKVGEDPAARALRVSGEGGDTKDGKDGKGQSGKGGDTKDGKSGTQKGTSDADGDGGKKDASTDVSSPGDVSLRKALLCGWADRVVRRVKRGEETDAERDAGGNTKATRYKPALLQSTVYLHPSSALHKTSPEYAAYCDLQRTEKRAYLGGATAVDAGWLTDHASALCTLGPALQDPPPRYVQHKGHVVQFTQPHFGSHRWKLPLRASLCSVDDSLGYGAFAAALLSGAVSAPFGDLRDRLCAKPVLCARPEGKTQRRVGELVHQLTHRKVCTKASLRAQWEKDPKWLLQQARDWMRKGHEHALERLWPRIVAFVLMEGGGGDRAGVGFTEAVDTGSGLEREGGLWGLNCVSGDGVASSKASAKEKKEKNPAGPKKRKNNPAALDAGLSIWD